MILIGTLVTLVQFQWKTVGVEESYFFSYSCDHGLHDERVNLLLHQWYIQ